MTFAAPERRFRAWVDATMPAAPLERFRMAFAAIWIAYDATDLAVRGTQACYNWTSPPFGLLPRLALLQVALIVFEVALLLGWRVWVSALVCAFLRWLEWSTFIRLNDFAYFIVTALLLAQTRSTGGLLRRSPPDKRAPAWPRDLLVAQAGWMYFATAMMKLSPVFLSGGHLYVRHQYLAAAYAWPYPELFRRWTESLRADAFLAWLGVATEFSLAFALFFRRRRIAVPLACAVHGFGALSLNVWFFGASCVAQIALLTPGPEAGASAPPHPPPDEADEGRPAELRA